MKQVVALKTSAFAPVSKNTGFIARKSELFASQKHTAKNARQISSFSRSQKSFVSNPSFYKLNDMKTTISPSIQYVSTRRSFASLPSHSKIGLPALSPSMEKGNIVKWRKNEGDQLKPGDIIAEIETDKATVEFENTENGYLAKILQPSGAKDITVGDTIALMVDDKASVAAFKDYKGEESTSAPAAAKSEAPNQSESKPEQTQQQTPQKQTQPPKPAQAKKPKANLPPHQTLGLPALSPSMEKGNIVKWRKNEGDQLKPGDIIAEIETDKATVEFENTENGYLAKILYPAGTKDIPVGAAIGLMVDSKGDIGAFKDYQADDASSPNSEPEAEPQQTQEQAQPQQSTPSKQSTSSASSTKNRQQPNVDDVVSGAPPPPSDYATKSGVFASPLAKSLASQKNIDLSTVKGSGPNNRIIKSDVLNAKPTQTSQQAVQTEAKRETAQQPQQTQKQQSQPVGFAAAAYTEVPNSQIRKVTAQRLTMSKQTIPHYYLTMECKVDELSKLREKLNASSKGTFKLSVNDFVVKAAALALRKVPACNSSWTDEAIRRYNTVDINVAVNTDKGLFTPLIKDADKIGLVSINNQVKDLAEKAKANKIALAEIAPGTFTISNLGMFGISSFSAVINPPQACILAVGGTEQKVVIDENAVDKQNQFKISNVMSVTLSCDHRVVDGAIGAEYLKAFKELIEDPTKMLL